MGNQGASNQELMNKFGWSHEKMANEYIRNSLPIQRKNAALLSGFPNTAAKRANTSLPEVIQPPKKKPAATIVHENAENSGKFIFFEITITIYVFFTNYNST